MIHELKNEWVSKNCDKYINLYEFIQLIYLSNIFDFKILIAQILRL